MSCGAWCKAFVCGFVSIVLNLLLGLMPIVDNLSHIGGFFAGLTIGAVLFAKKHGKSSLVQPLASIPQQRNTFHPHHHISPGVEAQIRIRKNPTWCCTCVLDAINFIGSALLPLLFVFMLIALWFATDVKGHCGWCNYVNCVEFPLWGPPEDKWWDCTVCSEPMYGMTSLNYSAPDDAMMLHCPSHAVVTEPIKLFDGYRDVDLNEIIDDDDDDDDGDDDEAAVTNSVDICRLRCMELGGGGDDSDG